MNEELFVIDDDPNMLNYMEEHLSAHKFNVTTFQSPVEALESVDEAEPSLVISDVKMNELMGDDVLNKIMKDHPAVGVILITGFGNIPHSVRSIRKGAFDYITKPFSGDEFISRVKQYFSTSTKYIPIERDEAVRNAREVKAIQEENIPPGKILIGKDPSIKKLISLLPKIAPTNAPVMIQGESGTGKEVYANLIQYRSDRADKPFIKINCANLPSELVESTLFGHVKGAFTGATEDKKGAFQVANGGTLLLDEVTEIDISLQAKLLRVLQEKEFHRVGSQEIYKSDVRIISTTNRNIANAIAEDKFRKDLYYRLNVIPIHIPRLWERKGDIPALAEFFCEKYTVEYQLPSKKISDKLEEKLMQKDWSGNIRELENYVQRGVIIANREEELKIEHVENPLFQDTDDEITDVAIHDLPIIPIEELELRMIKKTLEYTNNNQKKAAELLGISDRTIRNKLKQMDHQN